MRIYVGNLPYEVSEEELRETFSAYGNVTSVNIITDRATGRSKGFGFVEMPSASEGQTAISELNGKRMGDRTITVNPAHPPEERGREQPSYGRRRTGGGMGRPRR